MCTCFYVEVPFESSTSGGEQLFVVYTDCNGVIQNTNTAKDQRWQFEFDTEFDDVFAVENDPVGRLRQACDGVPIINYVEQQLTTLLRPDVNIWFEPLDHK